MFGKYSDHGFYWESTAVKRGMSIHIYLRNSDQQVRRSVCLLFSIRFAHDKYLRVQNPHTKAEEDREKALDFEKGWEEIHPTSGSPIDGVIIIFFIFWIKFWMILALVWGLISLTSAQYYSKKAIVFGRGPTGRRYESRIDGIIESWRYLALRFVRWKSVR